MYNAWIFGLSNITGRRRRAQIAGVLPSPALPDPVGPSVGIPKRQDHLPFRW